MNKQSSIPIIICFGDSLTAGYQSPTSEFPQGQETPYGVFLQKQLGSTARVVISGVCGELTAEMAMRFRQDVLAHKPAYVIVLGGTNDLGWNARPADVMRNLLKMYELALADGIMPVAVTVPSVRVEESLKNQERIEEHLMRRRILNQLISDYCARKGVACVDLFTATEEVETGRLAAPYSNDGLHLTTEGYKCLAKLLYDQVFATAGFADQQEGKR